MENEACAEQSTKVIKGTREEGKSKLLGLQKGMCVARVAEDGKES